MDCCPQWRDNHQLQQQQPDPALPLFELSTKKPRTTSTSTFIGMGSLFSWAQWQELELQALIYKYIMSGASVPLDLILLLKRNLACSSPHYHFQPSTMLTGFLGRFVVDPEPGRCRRTDGKKWRCGREVVAGQKYCERHVHRGRNRSRKQVEVATPTTTAPLLAHFTPSGPSPNQRISDGRVSDGCTAQRHCPKICCSSAQQERTTSSNNANSVASATHLSISVPESVPSDFSLKLSTGYTDNPGQVQPVLAIWSGWENRRGASLGGPLAEALHSTVSTTSPTSILEKPNGSVSETSSATT